LLVGIDACALVISGLAAAWVRFGTPDYPVAIDVDFPLRYWQVALGVAALWLIVLWVEGLHSLERLAWDLVQISRVVRALALGLLVVILLTFALKLPGLSRAWLTATWLTSAVLVSIGRWMLQHWLARQHRRGAMAHRTLVIGDNAEARRIVDVLSASDLHGLQPIGYVTHDGSAAAEGLSDIPVLGSAAHVRSIIDSADVEAVIIASSAFEHDEIARMIADLRSAPVRTHISSGLFEVLTSRVMVHEIAGVPLITVTTIGFTPARRALKRVFDVVVAGGIVLLGLPVWLLIALLVKTTSKGPVFYVQPRVGMDGRLFGMFKFRSMIEGADGMLDELADQNEAEGPLFKIKGDPRITPIGRVMRKHSIDEFPQLLNVLRGEMSLVGPRPPLPCETEEYDAYHWRRLEVPPGMTGLWQVSGRSELSFEEMVRLDLFYIENWSVGFDISLMLRTIPAVLMPRGAY